MTADEFSNLFSEEDMEFMTDMAHAMNVVSDFDREVHAHLDRYEARRKPGGSNQNLGCLALKPNK